jgi:hypothetical protein
VVPAVKPAAQVLVGAGKVELPQISWTTYAIIALNAPQLHTDMRIPQIRWRLRPTTRLQPN